MSEMNLALEEATQMLRGFHVTAAGSLAAARMEAGGSGTTKRTLVDLTVDTGTYDDERAEELWARAKDPKRQHQATPLS
jgi:hypothetical protein